MNKGGQVWMGQTDQVGMGDISSGCVCVFVGLGVGVRLWASVGIYGQG